ncbi:MAG: sensor histidine kinase [Candidatus Saccharimonadales bacterium]
MRRFFSKNRQTLSAEAKIQNRQEQSEIIIRSIADGVIVFDAEGKITMINPAAASLTEWPAEDAIGLNASAVIKLNQENGKPLDSSDDVFRAVLGGQNHIARNLLLIGQHDKQTVISLILSPINAPGSSQLAGAVAVFRDITTARQQEAQRAEFISTASHEMRTPVAAIEGYLALALNPKVSTIDSKARDYLEKAHESTQRLGQLFQDLLTSAKAEDGRLSNHPSVVEIGDFLQKLADDLRFAAEKKQLKTEFIIGSSETIDAVGSSPQNASQVLKPLYYVLADPDRLSEVITNLFDNAVKYSDQGKVSIGLTGDNQVVQIYVRDTGSGIPAEDVPHLFQKFYRVDNSSTRTVGGTGLGLFICRKIIELYNGQIWVESQPGQGSTFFINLPRLGVERAELLKASQQAQNSALST